LAPYQYVTNDDGTPIKDHQGNLLKQSTGAPYRVMIPAGASLELKDEEWLRVQSAAKGLLESGHLVFIKRPASTLTKPQILKRIKRLASVELDHRWTKDRIIVKAEQLEVDVWVPYTDEEVALDEAAEVKDTAKETVTKD